MKLAVAATTSELVEGAHYTAYVVSLMVESPPHVMDVTANVLEVILDSSQIYWVGVLLISCSPCRFLEEKFKNYCPAHRINIPRLVGKVEENSFRSLGDKRGPLPVAW